MIVSLTVSVQTEIEASSEEDYETQRDHLIDSLQDSFDCVTIDSEDTVEE